jgi:hypothetical protein
MGKIFEIIGDIKISTLALTLIFIYMEMMIANFYECKTNFIEEEFCFFHNQQQIQEKINTQEFWHYILENLKPFVIYGKDLIFFKQNFQDWLSQYITKKI